MKTLTKMQLCHQALTKYNVFKNKIKNLQKKLDVNIKF